MVLKQVSPRDIYEYWKIFLVVITHGAGDYYLGATRVAPKPPTMPKTAPPQQRII
jgi:hypothetical protein